MPIPILWIGPSSPILQFPIKLKTMPPLSFCASATANTRLQRRSSCSSQSHAHFYWSYEASAVTHPVWLQWPLTLLRKGIRNGPHLKNHNKRACRGKGRKMKENEGTKGRKDPAVFLWSLVEESRLDLAWVWIISHTPLLHVLWTLPPLVICAVKYCSTGDLTNV